MIYRDQNKKVNIKVKHTSCKYFESMLDCIDYVCPLSGSRYTELSGTFQHHCQMRDITLIFMVVGARAVISFCMRSAIPGYMVVPPESTVLAYRSLRMSTSHFMMLLKVVSWIPQDSIPVQESEENLWLLFIQTETSQASSLPIQSPCLPWYVLTLLTKERGLEEGLGATEPLISNGDDLSIGQLVALLQG